MAGFNYNNTETIRQKGGRKIVRKVSIKNGKGHKSITKYHRGKKLYTVKKPIHKSLISLIKKGKFIPGLFRDCKTKRRRGRGGGDIEEGIVQEVTSYSVPPDPERFKHYETQMVKESLRPVSPEEVENVFAGLDSKQKEAAENQQMGENDPMYEDEWRDLNVFSGEGGKKRN